MCFWKHKWSVVRGKRSSRSSMIRIFLLSLVLYNSTMQKIRFSFMKSLLIFGQWWHKLLHCAWRQFSSYLLTAWNSTAIVGFCNWTLLYQKYIFLNNLFGKMFQATFTSERDADDVFQGFKNWSQAERAAERVRVLRPAFNPVLQQIKVAASHVWANNEFWLDKITRESRHTRELRHLL